MATLTGTIHDATTGNSLAAKVSVQSSHGRFLAPDNSLETVGTTNPFFYCDGTFTLECPRGQVDVHVERGTEYAPLHMTVDLPLQGSVNLELPLQRWISLPSQGLYPGNTHIHYREFEARPEERLRFDSTVEDLTVTIISVLQRQELDYATNRFPVGRMEHPTVPDHVLDVGEEARHNATPWDIGYGHVMLVRLQEQVEPLSRGVLVDESAPDYPPLIDACATAQEQGGVTIWCHNGQGMEAPIAAGLGRLDALNLFDPYWSDPEYDLWYHLLNCGFRLPVSTGSDWFVCSANRVYVQLEDSFSYDSWLSGLKSGATFITNGPALTLRVAGQPPGQVVDLSTSRRKQVNTFVRWQALRPVQRIELVCNGEVVAREEYSEGLREGVLRARLTVPNDSWIAARCWGRQRDSYGHAQWAHTSPVYVQSGGPNPATRASAEFFVEKIEHAITWVSTQGRFDHDDQRQRMLEIFSTGREQYARLARG